MRTAFKLTYTYCNELLTRVFLIFITFICSMNSLLC